MESKEQWHADIRFSPEHRFYVRAKIGCDSVFPRTRCLCHKHRARGKIESGLRLNNIVVCWCMEMNHQSSRCWRIATLFFDHMEDDHLLRVFKRGRGERGVVFGTISGCSF